MSLFSLIILSIAVSVDGFWCGTSFGLRRIKISLLPLVLIGLLSFFASYATMFLGQSIVNSLSLKVANWFGALIIIGIGFWALKEGRGHIKTPNQSVSDENSQVKPIQFKESFLLGLAVATDASIAAFAAGLAGFHSILTPIFFGIAHSVLVGLGNLLAMHKLTQIVSSRLVYLPGLILITLGIFRVLD